MEWAEEETVFLQIILILLILSKDPHLPPLFTRHALTGAATKIKVAAGYKRNFWYSPMNANLRIRMRQVQKEL
jgi:hypothetical protein